MNQYRHGDVFIQQVNSLPENVKARVSKVVAEGEVTGHAHTLIGECEMFERNGQLWVRTGSKEVTITHQEHARITLPSNSVFQVINQREYDPEGDRRVQD